MDHEHPHPPPDDATNPTTDDATNPTTDDATNPTTNPTTDPATATPGSPAWVETRMLEIIGHSARWRVARARGELPHMTSALRDLEQSLGALGDQARRDAAQALPPPAPPKGDPEDG